MSLTELLFSFEGRISRKAYWFTVAIFVAAQIMASMFDVLLTGSRQSVVSLVVSLLVFVSSIAVSAKRWHDRDKSAWWILIGFIPILGLIWVVVENGFLRGTHGPNRFGPEPLE